MNLSTPVDSLQHLLKAPYLYYAVAAVLFLVALFILRSYRRSNQGIVPFKSQGGKIEIAPQTLRVVMQNAANSVEGVERAACRHFIKGRTVGVKVAIHLRANHRLRDVEATIKQRICDTLLDQFGMENVEPIHIRVTRIVGDPIASVQEASADPEQADFETPEQENGEVLREAADERPDSDETRT